jgi:prepilin-type N-terminal cleavage/methylation domain-containing protein
MHRIWKALRDRRGFTLIEIAIVIAIIGILLLIALPLFSGARLRAYTAEARQLGSEWKALAWSCLVEKNFKETKCDTLGEIGWTPPSDSDAWDWSATSVSCNDSATIAIAAATTTCAGATDNASANNAITMFVNATGNVNGLPAGTYYLLALRTNTGKTQEATPTPFFATDADPAIPAP